MLSLWFLRIIDHTFGAFKYPLVGQPNNSNLLTCSQVMTRCFLFPVLGGMMSLAVKSKTQDTVKCEVVDGGELKSRRHLNVRGKSATLPSITG